MTKPTTPPVCALCGAPATVQVGHLIVGGDGYRTFILDHWECARCARRELRIEHT